MAHKDEDMEGSTIEFFKRQEQPAGLARALFSANVCVLDAHVLKHMTEVRRHTWPPLLWKHVYMSNENVASAPLQFRVQEDGMLEMRAELLCVAVRFMTERGRSVVNRRIEPFLRASRPNLNMCIAPIIHVSRFAATAPEDVSCNLGMAHVLMYYDCDQASCSSSNPSSSTLKRVDQLRDGESFNAHLVLPMHHYRLAAEECRSVRATTIECEGKRALVNAEDYCDILPVDYCDILPVVVVQGNILHAPVSKIGCFVPTFVFLEAVDDIIYNGEGEATQFPAFTFVDKIVIS
ncbi:hypothetical protein L7F22_068546 [Adiantum nelumboides]|nr:hypothetical protein [Adiantum nelumboides]